MEILELETADIVTASKLNDPFADAATSADGTKPLNDPLAIQYYSKSLDK